MAAVSYTFPWAGCIARFKFQADPSLARALAHLMRHAPWVEPALDAATLARLDALINQQTVSGNRYNEQANREVDTEVFAG